MNKIILASQSPRRKELLKQVGIDFISKTAHVEEVFNEKLPLSQQIIEVASAKAKPIAFQYPEMIVIGADTMVILKQRKIGKCETKEQAREILSCLSNQTHQVITGVSIHYRGKETSFYAETDVTFYQLSSMEIDNYLQTDEWKDKAGAYAIQGLGARFIASINGDYNNIVGLPIGKLVQVLKTLEK